MEPALKLNVLIAHPSYGGNGGISSEVPDIREWALQTVPKMKADPRIGYVETVTIADTPVTLVRNRFVKIAKERGCHLLLMVDSDQSPNKHAGEHWYKPFWDVAFDFIYERYGKGPHVVGAPYCGPPGGGENVYVFQWENEGERGSETIYKLDQYTRAQAAMMSGIQEVAALPTGMILYDMRCFDLIEPSKLTKRQVLDKVASGELSPRDAEAQLIEGYFHYEWKDQYADEKGSTEDVSNTRNIAMNGMVKLGYNPVYCAWDSWIGHWKPWNVGKPVRHVTEQIGSVFKAAVLDDCRMGERCIDLELPDIYKAHLNGHAKQPVIPHLPDGNRPLAHVGEGQYAVANISTGNWTDHGHAPEYQRNVLADIVRAQAYKSDREATDILEVGSWLGSTAIAMADAVSNAKVTCVDTWEGTPTDVTGDLASLAGSPDAIYAEFCRRVGERLGKSITVAKGKSVDVARQFDDCSFDVIFIDADHTYEGCKSDILAWWGKLREGGVMVGHDMEVHGHDGVVQAVKECFGSDYETCGWHPQGAMWVARKRQGEKKWFEAHDMPQKHLDYLLDAVTSRLSRQRESVRVLEVGSWLGESALTMAAAGAKVHCVDTWQGTPGEPTEALRELAGGSDAVYEKFLENVAPYLDNGIYPFRLDSLSAAAMYWDQFDIIFIDADHSYGAVKADIEAWYKHLKPGGIMLGHDYKTRQFPGVTQAVEEVFGDLVETVAHSDNGSMWRVVKPAEVLANV